WPAYLYTAPPDPAICSLSLHDALPILVLLVAWAWWLIPRQVRAIGYAELEDDLLIRKGVLFRSLTVVPYGRMQYVDVQAGPLMRRAGMAQVQLHTASASTDASIPGLLEAEASRLRDRLTEAGEARLAGLGARRTPGRRRRRPPPRSSPGPTPATRRPTPRPRPASPGPTRRSSRGGCTR